MVVVSDELLERRAENLHSMLDYGRHAAAGSRFNTPPVFAIYVFMLVLRWIDREFGDLEVLAASNREKAQRLYDVIDQHSDLFHGHASADSRSDMNVTFRFANEELDRAFLDGAGQRGLAQLKGHRSVGGIRASIYNAMPRAGVEALRDYMLEFRSSHG